MSGAQRFAIVSVYDKTGLEPFARGLSGLGFTILSTGGTAKFLSQAGISVQMIESFTGHPEILEGRVKTLHPRVHGGILGRRGNVSDEKQLKENNIPWIDLIVVNLYPFKQVLAEQQKGSILPDPDELVEYIDIGGPTMIRAGAKNYKHVTVVSDPSDYDAVLAELKGAKDVSPATRLRLASKVFATMAGYDGEIARYLSLVQEQSAATASTEEGESAAADAAGPSLAPLEPLMLERVLPLRYGENPHQVAGLYRLFGGSAVASPGRRTLQMSGGQLGDSAPVWSVHQGKQLSYNNILDMYAAIDLFLDVLRASGAEFPAVIIKHTNPCGVALGRSPLEAFKRARECDPVSAFGGIVAIGGVLDKPLAECITEGFVEVVVADKITPEAFDVFGKKKNLRLITCDFERLLEAQRAGFLSVRNYFGDFLLQGSDRVLAEPTLEQVCSKRRPEAKAMRDLVLAWNVCKHVKSNAIVLVKDGRAVGVGAGQMSRVDAAKIAVERARLHGHDVQGASAASDAFLPFPDTLVTLHEAGVSGLVQPGGSVKDSEVLAEADSRDMVMLYTGERHFRH